MVRKKILIFILVVSMILAMPLSAFSQSETLSYSDIEGHWAQHMIEEFTALGYLEGYRDGSFRPDYPITRAEAGAFVARLGFPELYPLIVYNDLYEDTWYYDSVKQATQTGFVHGYPDGTYRPESFILREEATKLASLFWGQVDMEGFEMKFNDMYHISDWAFDHICKLVKMDLLDGYPDNTIRPRDNLTRAEFVKLFYMLLVQPKYSNVTVRAVDINNPFNDIVEAKILSFEIGIEAEFEAPEVPSRWYLVGSRKQIHPITQDLEVVFTYDYIRSSSTPAPRYTLSLEVASTGGGTVFGGGNYTEGTSVQLNAVAEEGYKFWSWSKYVLGDYEDISYVPQYVYTMPAEDVILQAVFSPDNGNQDCDTPTLIANPNYNVDQVMTLTYEESDGEFDIWRSNASKVVIWQLRYEGPEPIPFKLVEIPLPNAGIDISILGQVTVDPSIIEELREAGYNYQIDIIGKEDCETSVVQYIQAGAVNYLEYLPLRPSPYNYDFDGKIYPSNVASYNEQSFVTIQIQVGLYDQYRNPCKDGPSYSQFVYAFEGGGATDWKFSSYDGYHTESVENRALAHQGMAYFAYLQHTIIDGTELGGKYITFRAYLPGEPLDETGKSVTIDTSTFEFLPVN
jgi:hypothetical protein